MIILFEKYISQLYDNDIQNLADDIGVSVGVYNKIVDQIAEWYYGGYYITFLGAGSYGSAFRVNNKDRVLKITSDDNEAANVSYLVKKTNVKGIAEYHDIHRVDIHINNKFKFTLYSILMERLYDIASIENDIFMFLFHNYFKNLGGDIDFFNEAYISKESIGCSWKQFQELNPNKIDDFVDANKSNIYKYEIKEVKRLANIYYEDIMDIIYSVFKYDLELSDVHGGNIRKQEDEHIKLIDVGGHSTNKTFKTKSAKIDINVEYTHFVIYISNDGEKFKRYEEQWNEDIDKYEEAEYHLINTIVNDTINNVTNQTPFDNVFYKTINREKYQIYEYKNTFYLIKEVDDNNIEILQNVDPNQLEIKLMTKSGHDV